MTHFRVLIIIPKHVYILGAKAIHEYMDYIMDKYQEEYQVEPYIAITNEELVNDHTAYCCKYNLDAFSFGDYVKQHHGYDLDKFGNAVSTLNNNSLYDWYTIGGRFAKSDENSDDKNEKNGEEDDKDKIKIKNNTIVISDLYQNKPEIIELDTNEYYEYVFEAVVDKMGLVQKKGNYGWFGTVNYTQSHEEWMNKYNDILRNSINDYGIILDCHI
jgi:hypothetical protein